MHLIYPHLGSFEDDASRPVYLNQSRPKLDYLSAHFRVDFDAWCAPGYHWLTTLLWTNFGEISAQDVGEEDPHLIHPRLTDGELVADYEIVEFVLGHGPHASCRCRPHTDSSSALS